MDTLRPVLSVLISPVRYIIKHHLGTHALFCGSCVLDLYSVGGVHLSPSFPLITCVHLVTTKKIIYHHEALQMPELLK